MDLMCNAEVILTKNKIIAGIVQLFAGLQDKLASAALDIPALQPYLVYNSKITKGENYLGLPFVNLDYPRLFQEKNILAIRTMFWWGRHISMTLHVSGEEKQKFIGRIETHYDLLAKNNFFIGIEEDQWQHHFEKENYTAISGMSREAFIDACNKHDHLKIAAKWNVREITGIESELRKCWHSLVEILA